MTSILGNYYFNKLRFDTNQKTSSKKILNKFICHVSDELKKYLHLKRPVFLSSYRDVSTENGEYTGKEFSNLFYRRLDQQIYQNPVDKEIVDKTLKMMSSDVQQSVAGAQGFQATHGLVVTWYKYTFQGASCAPGNQGCPVTNYFLMKSELLKNTSLL